QGHDATMTEERRGLLLGDPRHEIVAGSPSDPPVVVALYDGDDLALEVALDGALGQFCLRLRVGELRVLGLRGAVAEEKVAVVAHQDAVEPVRLPDQLEV